MQVEAYLRRRELEFASYLLIEKGLCNFGEWLSNAVEQINGAAGALRGGGFIDLIFGLLFRKMSVAVQKRSVVAAKTVGPLTPNIAEKARLTLAEGSKLKVDIILCNRTEVVASVHVGIRHTQAVKLTLDGFGKRCSCGRELMLARPCPEIAGVFAKLATMHVSNPASALYNYGDRNWFSPVFWLETWQAQLASGIRVPSLNIDDLAFDDHFRLERLLPKRAGRPAANRRVEAAVARNPGLALRHCSSCGATDHNKASCTTPDFDYQLANLTGTMDLFVPLDTGAETPEERAERSEPTLEWHELGPPELHIGEAEDDPFFGAAEDSSEADDDVAGAVELSGDEHEEMERVDARVALLAANMEVEGVLVDVVKPVDPPCQGCNILRVCEAGVFRLITCSSCLKSWHARRDCANPTPTAGQRRKVDADDYKCSVCRGQSVLPTQDGSHTLRRH